MGVLRNSPIGTKLNILTCSVTVTALLVAGIAFAIKDLLVIRAARVEQLHSLAELIGESSTAALEFMDRDSAKSLLNSFRSQSSVEQAVLFDGDGNTFATYQRPGSTNQTATFFSQEFKDVSNGGIVLSVPIRRGDEVLGAIHLRSQLNEVRQQFVTALMILGAVMIGALALSFVISRPLKNAFTAPLMALVDVMRDVSQNQSYSRRVSTGNNDEFGVLCQGFNEMLGQIEHARQELHTANEELEQRVVQRTAELERAKNAAEAASRAKSDFLAKMSHEIRTPMTAILGFADVLQDSTLPETERLNSVNTIRRNGEHLAAVINHILDISKIEAGKMSVERIATFVPAIVSDVISLLKPKAQSKNLTLEARVEGDISETINSDPTRLKQVLMNLIGNSIKFTEQGFISLVIRQDQSSSKMEFEVRDSGIGMSADHLAKLFQPFAQGDDSMNRRFGGTGLGLAISRSFARLLGGDLTVVSEVGRGTTMTVAVEVGDTHPSRKVRSLCPQETIPSPVATDSKAESKYRILLVEDGPDNQKLISFVLRKTGAEVTVCENGLLGMEAALAARDAGRPFDLIVTDMQMPVMDGYEATTRLRLAGYTYPIIALTAHAMTDDCQRCLNAGCDDYSTKPLNRPVFLSMVDTYVKRGSDDKWLNWQPAESPLAVAS